MRIQDVYLEELDWHVVLYYYDNKDDINDILEELTLLGYSLSVLVSLEDKLRNEYMQNQLVISNSEIKLTVVFIKKDEI